MGKDEKKRLRAYDIAKALDASLEQALQAVPVDERPAADQVIELLAIGRFGGRTVRAIFCA